MRASRVIHVCSFDAVEKNCNARTKYEDLRAAVLEAGRFSVFEATKNQFAAKLYGRLHTDPTVVLTIVAFPWTEVRAVP